MKVGMFLPFHRILDLISHLLFNLPSAQDRGTENEFKRHRQVQITETRPGKVYSQQLNEGRCCSRSDLRRCEHYSSSIYVFFGMSAVFGLARNCRFNVRSYFGFRFSETIHVNRSIDATRQSVQYWNAHDGFAGTR